MSAAGPPSGIMSHCIDPWPAKRLWELSAFIECAHRWGATQAATPYATHTRRQEHPQHRTRRGPRPPSQGGDRTPRPRYTGCQRAGTLGGSQPGKDVCAMTQRYFCPLYVTVSPTW